MEMRPQSIFSKVMSLFHKNIPQTDTFCSIIDFLFSTTKWTLSNGKAASSSSNEVFVVFLSGLKNDVFLSFFKRTDIEISFKHTFDDLFIVEIAQY